MGDENNRFDEARFRSLIDMDNHLGAWSLLKAARLERTEESIMTGVLANSLVAAIAAARRDDDREKQAFKRSLLAYILKEWPGLASLYREQTRLPLPGFVPDNLQDIWQEFSDVMSGRKGLDESLRQRMDETRQKAREYGVDTDPIQDFVQQAEKELRKGASELGDFLKTVFGSAGAAAQTPGGRDTDSKPEPEAAKRPESGKADDPVIKVKIQDAGDPLPKDIHQAPPADREG